MKSKIKASRNRYEVGKGIAALVIISQSGVQHVIKIDEAKLEAVQGLLWRYEKAGPTASLPEGGKILLQRLLMNLPQWEKRKIKFINGDRHYMRLSNMRLGPAPVKYQKTGITRTNQTGFVGVYHRKWHDATGRFRPFQAFTGGRKKQSLGHFAKAEDAAEARARWIKQNDWQPKKRGRPVGWRKNKDKQGE